MTVQELIDELMKIESRNKRVLLEVFPLLETLEGVHEEEGHVVLSEI